MYQKNSFQGERSNSQQKYMYPDSIYIYDGDYEVARIDCVLKGKVIEAVGADAMVSFNAYVEKAIVMLLTHKVVDKWVSDRSRSNLADALHRRLSKYDFLNVIGKHRFK